jgi:hypothetical protein
MDPALIALLALLASALQVAILRIIDYYYPRGHTHSGDRIAETKAERDVRHQALADDREKTIAHEDDDFDVIDDSDT